jgi:hypothetical protein
VCSGDLGFDPLGLRFSYPAGLEEARARELAYGRIGALQGGLSFALFVISLTPPPCG